MNGDLMKSLANVEEIEPPETLDALVLERALYVLESERPESGPVSTKVPAVEALAYAAGVAVYAFQAMNFAVRVVARVVAGL